jgi:hypothetical protein
VTKIITPCPKSWFEIIPYQRPLGGTPTMKHGR